MVALLLENLVVAEQVVVLLVVGQWVVMVVVQQLGQLLPRLFLVLVLYYGHSLAVSVVLMVLGDVVLIHQLAL
jgi:hypothetical protein